MNKYKMISICSFIIVCVLLVSMLLPIKTIEEDKESLELNMHYEDSKVTAEITVNSDIYTGIVCKYLMVDDVLKSDNILAQTKESGITINMDKNENNIYKTVIPNVTKRYVVIYVSIGNCSLCDFIDCQPNQNQNEQSNQNQNEQPNQNQNEQQNQNQNEQQNQNQNEQPNQNQNEQQDQNKNEQPNQNQNEQQNQNKNEQSNQNEQQNQNKNEQPNQNQNEQPNQNQNEQQNQNVEPKQNQNEQKNNGNVNNNNSSNINNNTSDNSNVKVIDKDNIDTSDFQEIEKVVKSTTSDGNMPQTGEDDFAKILGIVVFSILSIFSFYKYEKTK